MINIYGDLFKQTDFDAICITTNGFIKRDGTAVMGKGCAYVAKQRYPNIEKRLATNIISEGNIPTMLLSSSENLPYDILSFPVKPKQVLLN